MAPSKRRKKPLPELDQTRTTRWVDRTGEIKGRLTILGWAGRLGMRHYWNVLCRCGTLKTIRMDGPTFSCGCIERERPPPNWRTVRPDGTFNYWNTVYVKLGDEKLTIAEAARRTGINHMTIRARKKYGWPPERWLEPVTRRNYFAYRFGKAKIKKGPAQ